MQNLMIPHLCGRLYSFPMWKCCAGERQNQPSIQLANKKSFMLILLSSPSGAAHQV
jgi:hypothetical protein